MGVVDVTISAPTGSKARSNQIIEQAYQIELYLAWLFDGLED